jgi:NitT/TauT family transport system substrate-binding protein
VDGKTGVQGRGNPRTGSNVQAMMTKYKPTTRSSFAGALARAAAVFLTTSAMLTGTGFAADKQSAPAAERVVFLPHWIPQAQFAGYYMALEKGFYRREGLDVVILHGGPRQPVNELLASGHATIASHFLSAAVKLREEGMPVVHLAQITQRSALMLVAHKSHGVHTLKDLDGKKVSVWPAFATQPAALFRKNVIKVQTITQGATINLFMRGGVDAASAMWYNEYNLFLNSGLNEDEVAVFFYDKEGLNFPEDAIICLAETWRTRPEMCRKFVRASLAGWDHARNNSEETLDVVMRHTVEARTGTNRTHQRWMLSCMLDLMRPVRAGLSPGDLAREDFEQMIEALKESGELENKPAYEDFHVSPLR